MPLLEKIMGIGCPYHGLTIDGILNLPNKRIAYPGITNGDTQLVSSLLSHAKDQSVTPKSDNNDNRFEWRTQAIVSDNRLGGVHLGNNWLLYCDGNKVIWYLKLNYVVSGNQCVMNCTLQSVFGRFNTRYPQISRELAYAATSINIIGTIKPLNRFTFERKPDGSEALIHVYVKFDGENTIDFPQKMSLYEIWKLQLTGDGQLSKDNEIGLGIKGT